MNRKPFIILGTLLCLIIAGMNVTAQETKYPDYAFEYLGNDKWENFNRKMFNFDLNLNKYFVRPIHILWASMMPEYGMDRIKSATTNIEYPIRLISSLLQRDFSTSKKETIRFLANSTLGLGGLYDPAKRFFKIEPSSENMEQALAGCKMKQGPYLVLPVLASTSLRGVLGKILDTALNPASYIATPVLAMIKAAMTVNRTSFMQPLIKMIESNYADPYLIAKEVYALDTYIKCQNLDRTDVIDKEEALVKQENDLKKNQNPVLAVKKDFQSDENDDKLVKKEVYSQIVIPELLKGGTNIDEIIMKNYGAENFKLNADKTLPDYNPQCPVVDSMRTALFDLPGVDESVWNELSVWNRSFSKRVRTSSVNIAEGKQDYKFRYIMQKDKNSPVAIIYPSIGEGIMSSHSALLGKIFYDEGYSVVIQGSHFQWEFVESMPDKYYPGLPSNDADALLGVTTKILDKLQDRYKCEFPRKVIIGTSFGAVEALFLASKEFYHNTLGKTSYISICPPVELLYAMVQMDKNSEEWNNSSVDLKRRVALTAAKVLKVYNEKENYNVDLKTLPFTEDEGKLITGFLMHQKLSDLIFTIEKASKSSKSDIYNMINNMNFKDYAQKYLLSSRDKDVKDLSYETSLNSISDFLERANNYKIYHSVNDYLTNQYQLKRLKQYSSDKITFFDNGAHLGFLYRDEFIEDLKKTITSLK